MTDTSPADRAKAAELCEWNANDAPLLRRIRAGEEDEHPIVELFTEHRTETLETIAAFVERQSLWTMQDGFLSPRQLAEKIRRGIHHD